MTPQEIAAKVGEHFATSEWVEMSQERINQFAEATGDHQFIHVNEEMAKMTPFGGTIAHGFLTLSLLARFFEMAVKIRDERMSLNYGLNKVRFPAPVPVGSRLRARVTLSACDALDEGGLQMTWGVVIEREGQDKPVCVAQSLTRSYS